MTHAEGLEDLHARIDAGSLLTEQEAVAYAEEAVQADFDDFVAWVEKGGNPDEADLVIAAKQEAGTEG
jgi:hypothetical protein